MCPCWGCYVQRTECQRYGTWWPHCGAALRVAHFHMSSCCMYRCLWSVHLTVICLFEYVQEVSSQGETQWKAMSKAFLGRFSGLIENHHSCIPALKVTGSAVAVVYCALCLVLNSISKSHKSPNKPTLTTTWPPTLQMLCVSHAPVFCLIYLFFLVWFLDSVHILSCCNV